MKDPHVAIGSFDRKNIFYGVKSFTHGSTFVNELVEEISKYVENANSTIIYCTTVKDTEEVIWHLICRNTLFFLFLHKNMLKCNVSNFPRWDSIPASVCLEPLIIQVVKLKFIPNLTQHGRFNLLLCHVSLMTCQVNISAWFWSYHHVAADLQFTYCGRNQGWNLQWPNV